LCPHHHNEGMFRFALRLCPESQDLQLSCVHEALKPDADDSVTE